MRNQIYDLCQQKKKQILASTVDILIQNKKILQEKSFKYFGVTLTSDLLGMNMLTI